MKLSNFKKHQGFTLIEVVLTITLIGIGFIGIVTAFNEITLFSGTDQIQLLARQRAEEGIERVLYDKIDTTWANINNDRYADENLANNLTRATTITEVDPTDFDTELVNSGYKKVVVTVTHANARAQLTTLITNWGP